MTWLGRPIWPWGVDVPLQGIPLLGKGVGVGFEGGFAILSKLLGILLVVPNFAGILQSVDVVAELHRTWRVVHVCWLGVLELKALPVSLP